MRLTEEILKELIWEVLLEYEADHCRDLPMKKKLECDKKDRESRERSAEKRRKKEQFQTIPTPMQQLSKGIVSETSTTVSKKFRDFVSSLTPEEVEKLTALLKKRLRPTGNQLMAYCSRLIDASKGNLTIDPKDQADLRIKQVKQNKS